MSATISTCWKVRPSPRVAARCGVCARSGWPSNSIRPELSGNTPVMRLKVVLLPAPLGPINPMIRAAIDLEAHIVDSDQPAERLAGRLRLQQRCPRRRQLAIRQPLMADRHWRRRRRRRAKQDRPYPVGRGLQDQHQNGAERHRLEIAGVAGQPGQQVLQLIAKHGDSGRTEYGAIDPAGAAQHRHQQIFGAGIDAERTWRNRALEMRIEPARQPGQHGRIDKHHQLGGRGIDAERFGSAGAAPKRADRTPDPAAQQILRGDHGEHDSDPDHHEIVARIGQRMAADPQRRDAVQPVMRAEPADIAEQIEESDAPGDGAERQIVTGKPDRDRADQAGGQHRHDQRSGQGQPR